jgi:hypothetical protein
MKRSPVLFIAVLSSFPACVNGFEQPYSPQFRGDANKANLPKPALVMPVQACSASNGTPNRDARESARLVVGAGLWQALRLPGDAPIQRAPQLCDMIAATRDRAREYWQLSPAQAQTVRQLLASSPDKHAIVVPYYTLYDDARAQTATVRDHSGVAVGSYETGAVNRWETANVLFGVFVISPDGYAWGAESTCGPDYAYGTIADGGTVCNDAAYSHFDAAAQTLLAGFPWQELGLTSDPADKKHRAPAVGQMVDASYLATAGISVAR